MHQLVMRFFGEDRQTSQVLYRTKLTDSSLDLYTYSRLPVKDDVRDSYQIASKDMTGWLMGMEEGQTYRFDLIAYPSKKVEPKGELRRRSQRRVLNSPAERTAWLARKGNQYGFDILSVVELESTQVSGWHDSSKGGSMKFAAYHYQGVLSITNVAVFRDAVQHGIGPEKAYGCGMLLLQ